MNWIKILKWIPAKVLANKLPEILAFVLTKALGFLLTRYPHKAGKVIETATEITAAMANAVSAAEDGVITKAEIAKQKELWQKVFD